ncbi:MAG: hypothetical protein AAF517_08735 [Planctomycetota bacterium]
MKAAISFALLVVTCQIAYADRLSRVRMTVHEHNHNFSIGDRGLWRLFSWTESTVDGEVVRDVDNDTAYSSYAGEPNCLYLPYLEVASYPCTVTLRFSFWEGDYFEAVGFGDDAFELNVEIWEPGQYTLNVDRPDGASDLRATVQFNVTTSWACPRCPLTQYGPRFMGLLRCGESDGFWIRERNDFDARGPGYSLGDFVEAWENLSEEGYRLLDVESYAPLDGMNPYFIGRFEKGFGGYALFFDQTLGSIIERTSSLARDGNLLIDIEQYRHGEDLRFLGVYRQLPGRQVVRFGRWEEFVRDWGTRTAGASEMRLVELEPFLSEFGERMFLGVYHEKGGAHGLVGGDWPAFRATYDQSTNPGNGFQPVPLSDIAAHPYPGGLAFVGTYLQRDEPSQALLSGHTYDQFFDRVDDLERNGWSLEDFEFGHAAFPTTRIEIGSDTNCLRVSQHEPRDFYPLFSDPPEDENADDAPAIVGFEQVDGRLRLKLDRVRSRPDGWQVNAYVRDLTMTDRATSLGTQAAESAEWSCDDLPMSEGMLCVYACTCRTGESTTPSCIYFNCDSPRIGRFEVLREEIEVELVQPGPCSTLFLSILTDRGDEIETTPVQGESFILRRSELPVTRGMIRFTCRSRSGRETSDERRFDFDERCFPALLHTATPIRDSIGLSWAPAESCAKSSHIVFRSEGEELRIDVLEGRSDQSVPCSDLPGSRGEVCIVTEFEDGSTEESCRTYQCASDVSGQRPFDVNQDGRYDISDPVALLSILFLGGGVEWPCESESGNLQLLDWTADGRVDISDAVAGLNRLFLGGRPHPLSERGDCLSIIGCGGRTCL